MAVTWCDEPPKSVQTFPRGRHKTIMSRSRKTTWNHRHHRPQHGPGMGPGASLGHPHLVKGNSIWIEDLAHQSHQSSTAMEVANPWVPWIVIPDWYIWDNHNIYHIYIYHNIIIIIISDWSISIIPAWWSSYILFGTTSHQPQAAVPAWCPACNLVKTSRKRALSLLWRSSAEMM